MASHNTRLGNSRQKTKMEKITNESNRHVTFSKRKNGLFKKAVELSIMTETEIAIIVKSPGDKLYSFAHPSLEAVAHKCVTGNPLHMSYLQQQIQVQRNKDVTRKIAELKTVENDLDAEIKSGKDLNRTLTQSQNMYWGASDNLSQLKQSVASLKNLNANVKREIEARVLVGQQNYDAPTSDDELHALLLPLVGPTYNGDVSRNGLPTLPWHNLNQVNEGSVNVSDGGEGSRMSFTNGPNFFSGHGLPLSPSLNVHERNEGIGSGVVNRGGGNWSLNNGPRSSTGSGLPAFPGQNVYECGEGSGTSGVAYRSSAGKSYHNGNSSFSPRYRPYTRSLHINEGGQVSSIGGGSFYGGWMFNVGSGRGLSSTNGASSYVVANNYASGWMFNDGSGRGLPNTNGASSFGVANNDASGWMFNAGSGRGLPSTNGASSFEVANNDASGWMFNAGSGRSFPCTNDSSSSAVANNGAHGWMFNAGSDRGFPCTNDASSSAVANNGVRGWMFNAGSGRGLPNTNGSSSSGVANNNAGPIDGISELDGFNAL